MKPRISKFEILKLLNQSRIKENVRIKRLLRKKLKTLLASKTQVKLKTSTRPVVSVVIVNYNSPELLMECLGNLQLNSNVPKEIIIIDNNSNPQTKVFLSRLVGARIVYNRKNVHFLKAANQGALMASGRFILFLNSDCFVSKGSVESCIKKIEKNPQIGVVGSKVMNLNNSVQEAGSMILKNGAAVLYGWLRTGDNHEVCFDRYVDFVMGCFLLTTKAIFKKLNGFDLRYSPAYFEEADFCYRVNKIGKRVLYNSEAKVYHVLQGSTANNKTADRLVRINRLKFYKKHRESLKNRPAPSPDTYYRYRSVENKKKLLIVTNMIPNSKKNKLSKQVNDFCRKKYLVTVLAINQKKPVVHNNSGLDIFVEIAQSTKSDFLETFLKARATFFDLILVQGETASQFFKKTTQQSQIKFPSAKIVFSSTEKI